MHEVVIGLGSNLGNRRAQLASALRLLTERGILFCDVESTVVESEALIPAGGGPQPPYLNQVVIGRSELEPHRLLAALHAVERELGREPAPRWSARVIDIDILDYEGRVLADDALTLPHPGIAEREFVLDPWAEIAPRYELPDPDDAGARVTIAELRSRLLERTP